MQLNKFKAVAKPRNHWQAIDLGFIMARAWYMQLLLLWVLPAGILFLVLVFFFYEKPYLPALIVWWCKPIWERPILHVISRQLFDNQVSTREVFRSYLKIVRFDLLSWVTWRRLSFYRAFDMPVTQLEQLKGTSRSSRINLLHLRFSGAGSWLLLTCVHIELFILLGVMTGLALLLPQGVDPNWQLWLMDHTDLLTHLYNAVWFFSAALVAPFYVCAGFSLYLQRRIDLEAWDIEIQFRRLLQRKNTRKSMLNPRNLALLLIGVSLMSFPSPKLVAQGDLESEAGAYGDGGFQAQAAGDTRSVEQTLAKREIEDVYQSKDFRNIEHRSGIRLIPDEEKVKEENPQWLINFAEWLESGGSFFAAIGDFFLVIAKFVEVILWMLLAVLVSYVLYYYRSFILRVVSYRAKENEALVVPPKTLFGLDVTEDSLPEDIVHAAHEQWEIGNQRSALALLLRASIVEFIDMRCVFFSGNTEKECAFIVRKKLSEQYSHYFDDLVKHWQALAYAHIPCDEEEFYRLCALWRETFRHA